MDVASEIAAKGTVTDGFVAVDRFLNHRVDPQIVGAIGNSFGAEAIASGSTLVLTAEASGIPVGLATASAAGLPLVYAKKYSAKPGDAFESRSVTSATKGGEVWLGVDRSLLGASDRIIIVDDVLATGAAVDALIGIATSCRASVVGVCCVIEKTWLGGGDTARQMDIRVVSLVSVASPNGRLTPTR